MDKKEIKQKLLIVSFNKIKDLILVDKVNEAQAALEMLTAQLKEIDNSYRENISFKLGDYVTLDDPEAREAIDINSYRDIGYLNNVYRVIQIDNHYIYLKAIKNREGDIGITEALTWRNPKEVGRITKLNIKSQSVSMSLGDW